MEPKRSYDRFISAAFRSNASSLHRKEALLMASGVGDSQAVQRLIEEFRVWRSRACSCGCIYVRV